MRSREEQGRQVYQSVGKDAFLLINPEEKIFRAGWYIFSYTFRLEGGKIVAPRLYFDYGHGFTEQHHWKLFYSGNEIFGLVKIPWNCFRLRFDISVENIAFETTKLSIKKAGKVYTTLHLFSILDKLGVGRRAFLRELFSRKTLAEKKKLLRSVSDGSYLAPAYQEAPEKEKIKKYRGPSLDELHIHSRITTRKLSTLLQTRSEINEKADTNAEAESQLKSVDIILPVYNGLEYLQVLLPQIIANSDYSYKLYIVDDCSPDPRVTDFLEAFQRQHSGVHLLRNETNLGFTKTVNKLLHLCESEVIVLINSDIEVPSRWLSRLVQPLLTDKTIGTITPMSNCATICSFPNMGDNEMLAGLNVEDMNRAIGDVSPCYEDIPTGVGFCMAINKRMLDKVGMLNEQAFPRGYGEEVDLCFRARKNGFRNVMNMGLFVYHKHGGSFNSAERNRLLQEGQAKVERMYPEFTTVLQKYFADNLFVLFKVAYLLKLVKKEGRRITLMLDHDLGGGTNQFTKNFQAEQADTVFVTGAYINPNNNPEKQVLFTVRYRKQQFKFLADSTGVVLNLLQSYDIIFDEVIINNVVSYHDIRGLISDIIDYKKAWGKKVAVTVMCHDFFYICPNFLLFRNNTAFCGIPTDLSVCRSCLDRLSDSIDPKLIPADFESLEQWRGQWTPLLTMYTDRIVMFSESTRNLFLKVWPELSSIATVTPHALRNFKRYERKTYNVAILGSIHSVAKGAAFVHELAEYIKTNKLDHIRLVNFGSIHPHYDHGIIVKDGFYNYDNLHYKLTANKIDVILIPSVCSETFSFTTREAIETGIPTACFPIGGQYDQVKEYSKGIVIRDISPESFVEAVEEYFLKEVYETV